MPRNQPMYRQIADDLRTKVSSGELAPNTRLPTEGELSDQYEAYRNTLREAIRRLTDEGLLESRLGQGTFVARKVDPFVMDFITKGATKLLFASPDRRHQPRATRMMVA
jgi:DNA-binding GntR family transcriptional regulator